MRVRFVLRVDAFLALLVLCFILGSFFNCLVDVRIGHIGTGGNRDMLLFARAKDPLPLH